MKRTIALAVTICLLFTVMLLAGCGTPKPVLSSVKPGSGTPGSIAVISGSGFGKDQGSSKAYIADNLLGVVSWADARLQVKIPIEMPAGDYKLKVVTGGGTSNTPDYKVIAITPVNPGPGTGQRNKPGEIESNGPTSAMMAFLQNTNEATGSWTFSVYSVSQSDPNWKIDKGVVSGNPQPGFFLLHYDNGTWKVLEHGTDFNPRSDGAPADLTLTGTPPSVTEDETKVITNYVQSKGQSADGWTFNLIKESLNDPNWEIVQGTNGSTTKNFLLVWNNMLGGWEVLADGGPPWTGVAFKGESAPADLNTL
jgi:hypothetical protein